MKTSITTVSLVLAAAFPGSLLAEFAGVSLPAALSPATTFGVAVAVLTLLTAFADYARNTATAVALTPTSVAKLAKEERRLAA